MSAVEIVVAALTLLVESLGPGGVLVLCVAALLLQITDVLGDGLDAQRPRAATRQP